MDVFKAVRHPLCLLIAVLILGASCPAGSVLAGSDPLIGGDGDTRPPKVLQGSIKEVFTAPAPAGHSTGKGQVTDGKKPLAGVTVSLPAMAYRTVTRPDGSFKLPPLSEKAVITAFSKPGYLSASVTLDRDKLADQAFRITLQKKRTEIVLDEQWHHLGDNSYSPESAGSQRFRQTGRGPALTRIFRLPAGHAGDALLTIGSVVGLDTWEAHQAGQSGFHRYSTPMRVILNGHLAGYVALNGDRQELILSRQLLQPGQENHLVLETGYKVSNDIERDYDDMELMLLTLSFGD